MEPKLRQLTKKYWKDSTYTRYAIAKEMKEAGLCKYDMDCYRKLLSSVEKLYRTK